ncbi:MAG TPA: PQQ-binding-like beta-propeller repeat protein [Parachlamydiaceae bacterium]|nr:PQQ-binding-like beta-propeller repeat protein [Parachlamydiaceae bacterium]
MKKSFIPLGFFLLSLLLFGCDSSTEEAAGRDWGEFLGGPGRNQYSTLEQINRSNVNRLQVAWEYHTQDSGQMQCNPLIVDGVLYGMTASTQPFAVDAATGKELWKRSSEDAVQYNTSRGLTYWVKGEDRRILFTNGSWLYALDAKTGMPVASFGQNGRTSLKAGLGGTAEKKFVVSNAPGTVYEDLIIMPLRVHEGPEAALGHIQAFNIQTGKLAWVFHTIPQPGEFGYDTWPIDAHKNIDIGGANNWAGMAIDRKRGIVFVPTGSAAFDYYGGNRKGSNLFANSLLALDARTGERKWHFQLVHHDILDRDLPSAPNLITVTQGGQRIDAVAQVTKHGYVYVFDRVTGKPLFPIEERPVPASDIPGEESWPTQPFPVKPAPFARQQLTEADLSPYAENREELLSTFRDSRHEGPFTPLTDKGTIVFPGLDGGAEWGGAAADPEGVLYVNSNEMAWVLALGSTVAKEEASGISSGEVLYLNNCTACHGVDRQGSPAGGFPSLAGIGNRSNREVVMNTIKKGKGRMPVHTNLSDAEINTLVAYLFGDEKKEPGMVEVKEPGLKEVKEKPLSPYHVSRFSKFLDSKGLPAISPPWGTLNAIDLNTGEYVWRIPFGEYPELAAEGAPPTGAESYGGPVVTASGLLFIAGTKDRKFRAFDKSSGQLLWDAELPAAGFATPSTYEVNGRQYVVIACGGAKLGAAEGDSYVAFALPLEPAENKQEKRK